MDSFLQFLSDFRYEITMIAGIGLCVLLYVVTRAIFGPDKIDLKKIKQNKKKAAAKKAKKAAAKKRGSSLDDDDDEYKDHDLFGEEDAEGVYKDWD